MAAFAKGVYDAAAYSAFRPVYPRKLFDSIWAYHHLGRGKEAGGWQRALDLGCGTGQATTVIAARFEQTIGVDPSSKMVAQATEQLKNRAIIREGLNSAHTRQTAPLVRYEQSPAEDLPFLENESVDLVTAAQAIHWFNYPRLWKELSRILRPGGTAAFWGYSELRIRGYPNLTPLITYYSQGSNPIKPDRAAVEKVVAEPDSLAAYWEQPGRAILDAGLITVPAPPEDSFDASASKVISFSGDQRKDLEADFASSGRQFEKDEIILSKDLTWELLEKYCRTWSSLSNYLEDFPEEKARKLSNGGKGGEEGDILDRFLLRLRNEMLKTTGSIPEKVEIEWPMTLLLYRKHI